MNKLVWIGHYIEAKDAFRFNNFTSPSRLINKMFIEVNKRMPPYIFSQLENSARAIKIYGVIAPLLPSEIASASKARQFDLIGRAIDIANRVGAGQIGLAALFASLWEDGAGIKELTDAHITTGKNLIAALVLDYISKGIGLLGRDLKDLTIGIIGYRNRIAKIFVTHYLDKVKMILADDGGEKVSFNDIFSKSDAIIVTTMGVGLADYIDKIKPGTIVCDIVVPYHLTTEIRKRRKDVFAFEGVWSRYKDLDTYTGKDIKRLFPGNVIPACMGEPIILAQEKRLGNFSLGGNINHDNALLMRSMIAGNGFDFFGFKQGGGVYSQGDIDKMKVSYSLQRR
ncbi:MAG: hypothetical protein WC522_01715 [Candidatus Omnitrophota bacterium]